MRAVSLKIHPAEFDGIPQAEQRHLRVPHKAAIAVAAAAFLVYMLMGKMIGISVVEGISMEPAIHPADVTLFNRLISSYEAGDIIIFKGKDGTQFIKRVIGLPGDQVDISDDGEIIVNGVVLQEENIECPTYPRENGTTFPVAVDDGCVLVLGDNREVSKDSRNPDIGLVPVERIAGKVFVVFRTEF